MTSPHGRAGDPRTGWPRRVISESLRPGEIGQVAGPHHRRRAPDPVGRIERQALGRLQHPLYAVGIGLRGSTGSLSPRYDADPRDQRSRRLHADDALTEPTSARVRERHPRGWRHFVQVVLRDAANSSARLWPSRPYLSGEADAWLVLRVVADGAHGPDPQARRGPARPVAVRTTLPTRSRSSCAWSNAGKNYTERD